MQSFVILQIILSILYVAYLVYQYSLPQVSNGVKVSVYLTWLLSFGIVVLLPYDVYYSMKQDIGLQIVWKTMYWLIFVLTWLFLPIAQQYQSAGQFTPLQKLKRAIINNLIIYGIFALVGGLFLAYLYIVGKFDLQKITPVLMAASNYFGMLLVVIFLSYGLVDLPKTLWRQQNYQMQLKYHQFMVYELVKKKQNVIRELQLKTKQALWYKLNKGENSKIAYIISLIPNKFIQRWNIDVPDLGKIDIVKLHKQVKQLTLQLSRLESKYEQLLYDTFRIEDILSDINSPNQRIQSTLFFKAKYDILNFIIWLWYCRIKKLLSPILAILLSIFALMIVIAELASFLNGMSWLNPLENLKLYKPSFIVYDCLLLIILGYIAFCVYYALFKLKFASYYGLYQNQQTDSASLIFFAINCSRVSTPLCYNFLQIINDKDSSFLEVMGSANVVPVFGETFLIVFPVLLILLILFHALDVYSRIAKLIGMESFYFQSQFEHLHIAQGRKMLRKTRTDIETRILNSNGQNLADFRSYKYEFLIKKTKQRLADQERQFFI